MSLHLTGGGMDRTNPRPNSTDVLAASSRPAHAAHSVNFMAGNPYYIVQPGDTLTTIATAYSTSVGQLQLWNNITDPNTIYAGQSLIVQNLGLGLQVGYLRLAGSGTTAMQNDGVHNTATLDITHGLGYRPLVITTIINTNFTDGAGTISNANYMQPELVDFNLGISYANVISVTRSLVTLTDESTVHFRLYDIANTGKQVQFTYYLFQQPIIAAAP